MAQATITPGPPLPHSHPSPSLLAKLYLNVYQLYNSARSLAKSVGTSSASGTKSNLINTFKRDKSTFPSSSTSSTSSKIEESSESISQEFRNYLSDGRAFSSSLAYKWLGVDAGEFGNKTGESIAWLNLAKTGLLGLRNKAKTVLPLPMRKGTFERSRRKDRLVEEIDDIDAFLKAYNRMNDTVSFSYQSGPLGQ